METKTIIITMQSKSKPDWYQSNLHIGGVKRNPDSHSWRWDEETLTLTPSVRGGDNMYHYFLRNGEIENCGDAVVNDLEVVSIKTHVSVKGESEHWWKVKEEKIHKEKDGIS